MYSAISVLCKDGFRARAFNAPAELATVIQHCTRVGVRHPVQSQCTRGGRRGGIQKGQGPVIIFVVLMGRMETCIQCVIAMLVNNHAHAPTCLSVSRAGECGRRGVECPELGGEGDARVEDVRDGGMKPRPVLSRPREDGGTGRPSRATLLTLLSISSARSSVLSFSS